jgi:L-lactate dehydrogenase complex protein LldG
MSTASREAILSRIRAADHANSAHADRLAAYSAISRDYLRTLTENRASTLRMFVERLHEYDAGIHLARADDLRSVVSRVLLGRGKRRLAVPMGLPAEWLPEEFQFVPANRLSPLEIDRLDGILSGCTLGIALTGTLVLQNADAQGPRVLSLVPDYHLCVIFADQVVGTVPEAFDRLAGTAHLPTTFISGPSATADIEMTRIKGVHGPRFLDVILVETAASKEG